VLVEGVSRSRGIVSSEAGLPGFVDAALQAVARQLRACGRHRAAQAQPPASRLGEDHGGSRHATACGGYDGPACRPDTGPLSP